jgi:hypothetical protein
VPSGQPNPLTVYQHGKLLEEGCIQVTKTALEKEQREKCESLGSSSDEDEGEARDDEQEHPNLRMQWTWSEIKG